MERMPLNDRKIKVVHLITLLEFGGAQGNTIHTVRNLDSNLYKTYLWSGKGAYWDSNVEEDLGKLGRLKFLRFLVRPVHPIYDFLAIFELQKALRQLKPDILHTHSSKAGILGRVAAKMAGIKTVVHTFHGFGFNDQQKPWTRWFFITFEKLTAGLATRLVFVSKSNQQTAKELGIGVPSQYVLIRSGIPVSKIREKSKSLSREAFKKSLDIPKGYSVITTIGAFKPQKNLGDFLKVAKSIKDQGEKSFFLIVGDGALRPNLEEQVKELGLSESVKLLGWREDVPHILSISDLFVMTSLWEGLPRSLVEAIILKVPALCYDTDGVRDLLGGFPKAIISQKDTRAMSSEISQYLHDNSSLSAYINKISDDVYKEFDIDQMVRQQEDLYDQIHSEK